MEAHTKILGGNAKDNGRVAARVVDSVVVAESASSEVNGVVRGVCGVGRLRLLQQYQLMKMTATAINNTNNRITSKAMTP